jgi:hypothetical protein
MKVQATHYKGIDFVSFQGLPAEQQLLLQHNTELERIQILIDGKVCRNCIQYKDYSDWYASVFLRSIRLQNQYTVPTKLSEIAVEA